MHRPLPTLGSKRGTGRSNTASRLQEDVCIGWEAMLEALLLFLATVQHSTALARPCISSSECLTAWR